MIQLIDWATVAHELTPTHLLVGVVGYVIVHAIIKALKFLGLITKGAIVSDSRRAIHYVHGLQNHSQGIRECQVGDCYKLNRT